MITTKDEWIDSLFEIVDLWYDLYVPVTREFHNQHVRLNWIDALDIVWGALDGKDKKIIEKYLLELKLEIKKEWKDKEYINILFKRFFSEINSMYFWKHLPRGVWL